MSRKKYIDVLEVAKKTENKTIKLLTYKLVFRLNKLQNTLIVTLSNIATILL